MKSCESCNKFIVQWILEIGNISKKYCTNCMVYLIKKMGQFLNNIKEMDIKCEACNNSNIQLVLRESDEDGEIYKICIDCFISLMTLSLNKSQFFNLLKTEHDKDAYLLHDDFYDEKGTALQPRNFNYAIIWHNLGNDYYRNNDLEKAIEYYEKAIEIEPDVYETWNYLGYAYNEKGNFEKAIESSQKAIEIQPDDYEPWYNLGYGYDKKGAFEKAIECYEKAIEIKLDNGSPWYNKACVESKQNNWKKAVESLKRAIELDKDLKIQAMSESDFDNIKQRIEFKELLD